MLIVSCMTMQVLITVIIRIALSSIDSMKPNILAVINGNLKISIFSLIFTLTLSVFSVILIICMED